MLFTRWYDEVASHATDLLDELLKLLRRWLALHPPFDAYLKILYLLSTLPELPPVEGGHPPTYYQQAVVARCLRQIADCGGTLAVLATGLGKTIVGAELAYRLDSAEEINTVILLAPNAVREAWAAEMEGRGLNHRFFPTDILFRPDSSRRHHLIHQISRQLRQANEKTLILIDEAHFYRNQILREKQTQQPSRVFARVVPAVRAGARIALLTATAYGTNSRNFDSLLNLLPHRQPDPVGVPGPWQARTPEEFSKLPVVTILGLPDVLALARRRGDVDAENRPFVEFQGERRYLPDPINLIPVYYELPLQEPIGKAFDAFCFDYAYKIPQVGYDDDAGEFETASDAGYNAALNSWLSSPPAMEELIRHNLATKDLDEQLSLAEPSVPDPEENAGTGQLELLSSATPRGTRAWGFGKGAAPYSLGIDWREKHLKPLRDELGDAPDQKLQELLQIVRVCCEDEGGKTLIFVRRHRTAVYLHDRIQKWLPHLDVACTIEERDGKIALKPRHARDEILRSFSPRSHGENPEPEHDVLVCTDADGVGVNLQDADNVVNYDPPSGADVLFQRAGRVLRLTPNPTRNVRVYTMIPSLVHDEAESRVARHVKERFKRLNRRHDKSREVTGSALLASAAGIDIMKESNVRVEDWFREIDPLSRFDARVENSLGDHMGVLAEHGMQAASLPQPIHTAKTMKRYGRPRVLVFFMVDGEYHSILHQPSRGRIRDIDFPELLRLSRCTPDEPRAPTRGEDIEAAGNTAVQLWCSKKGIEMSRAKKVCVIYLQPDLKSTDPRLLLFPLPGST
ncbi:MAG TPA: helicase-related protein [Longimicrobium sp.]